MRTKKTIDQTTLELLDCPQGRTFAEIFRIVARKFPNRDKQVLQHTTLRRLHGYLTQKYRVKIVRSDDGRYRIAPSSAKRRKIVEAPTEPLSTDSLTE